MDVMSWGIRFVGAGALAVGLGACVSSGRGELMEQGIAELKKTAATHEKEIADLQRANVDKDAQIKKLTAQVDEASKVVMRNSADVVGNVQKLQTDLASVTGRVDDLQTSVNGLSKSFTDYRAASDTALEKVVNATTNAKNPPVPETADAVFAEAQKRIEAKQWNDARRLLDAFINRFPGDARGAKAQFLIGESYMSENKYANAIGAYTKVVDNFPKSEIVPDAMFKNGEAFYALKYCGDARIYFQELLKRYPKTEWKKDANEELKKLQRDMKNKAVCQS
jgi:tol-pal system protein YbgF